MQTKNNIGKPAYAEKKVKEAVKLAMSESPEEEFNLDVLQQLSQFEQWKKDNPGKSYDDFLKEMGLNRKKFNLGGMSFETLMDMLKNEYPKEYERVLLKKTIMKKDLIDLLNNLDQTGAPFSKGGRV